MLLCPPLGLQSLTAPQGPWQMGPHSNTAPYLCTKKSKNISERVIALPPPGLEVANVRKKQKPRFKKNDLLNFTHINDLAGVIPSINAVGGMKDAKMYTEVEIELEAGIGGREGGVQTIKRKGPKPKKPVLKPDNNEPNYPHNDNEKENITSFVSNSKNENESLNHNEHNEKEFEFEFEVELSSNSKVAQFRTAVLDDGNGLYARKSRMHGPGSVHTATSLKGLNDARRTQNRVSDCTGDSAPTCMQDDDHMQVEGCVGDMYNNDSLNDAESMVVDDVRSDVMDCSDDKAGDVGEKEIVVVKVGGGIGGEGEQMSNKTVENQGEVEEVILVEGRIDSQVDEKEDVSIAKVGDRQSEREKESDNALRRRVMMNSAVFKILKAVDIARDVCTKQIIAENEAAAANSDNMNKSEIINNGDVINYGEIANNSEIVNVNEAVNFSLTVNGEFDNNREIARSGTIDHPDVRAIPQFFIEGLQSDRPLDASSGIIDDSTSATSSSSSSSSSTAATIAAAADTVSGDALQSESVVGIIPAKFISVPTISLDSTMCMESNAHTQQSDERVIGAADIMEVEGEVEGGVEKANLLLTDAQAFFEKNTHTCHADGTPCIESLITLTPPTDIPPLSAFASVLVPTATFPLTPLSEALSAPVLSTIPTPPLTLPPTAPSTVPSSASMIDVSLILNATVNGVHGVQLERILDDRGNEGRVYDMMEVTTEEGDGDVQIDREMHSYNSLTGQPYTEYATNSQHAAALCNANHDSSAIIDLKDAVCADVLEGSGRNDRKLIGKDGMDVVTADQCDVTDNHCNGMNRLVHDVDMTRITAQHTQGEKQVVEQMEEVRKEVEEKEEGEEIEKQRQCKAIDLIPSAIIPQPSTITTVISSSIDCPTINAIEDKLKRPWCADSAPDLICPTISSTLSIGTILFDSTPSIPSMSSICPLSSISPSTIPPSPASSPSPPPPPISLSLQIESAAMSIDDSRIDDIEARGGSMCDKEDIETGTHCNTLAVAVPVVTAVLNDVTVMDACESDLLAADVSAHPSNTMNSSESNTAPTSDPLPLHNNDNTADDASVATTVTAGESSHIYMHPRAIKTIPPVTASGIPLLTGWRSTEYKKILDPTFQANNQLPVSPRGGRGKILDPSSAVSKWLDYRRCCLCSSQNSETEHLLAEEQHFDASKSSPRPLLCGFINSGAATSRTIDEVPFDTGSVRDFESISGDGDAEHKNASTAFSSSSSCASPSASPLSFTLDDPVCGRLLPLPDGSHAHANCLRWSADVIERGGKLLNALTAKAK